MRRPIATLFLAFAALHLTATAARAQAAAPNAVRTDTPSGLPVPRFVGLKNAETFCRAGPAFAYPVAITYLRAGTPVLVVAETTDHWRKIRDVEGAECWTHQTTLRAASHVMALDETTLYARPDPNSAVRARLAPDVLARIERAEGDWARVSADGARGWAQSERLWGVERHIAAHN